MYPAGMSTAPAGRTSEFDVSFARARWVPAITWRLPPAWWQWRTCSTPGQAIASRQPEARRLGLRVAASLACARTAGDRDLAGRLIANLLDNALRYNIPDGLVEVSTSTHATKAVVRVGNTGPAVPASEISDLFQPFRRPGDKRTRHGDSHGLGLSIVSAIATAHHAAVNASARPGGGLDIEVCFPAVPAGNERAR